MTKHSANSYKLLATLSGQHDDTIACMQFSPCGEHLVTGGDDLRMNVFDCTSKFRNILSISSTSPASAICWDPTKPKSCFVGYSGGAVVSHTFGNNSEEWAAEILLFNGRCRVVALAWDKALAIATERNVCLIKDIKAGTDGQRGTIDTQRGTIDIQRGTIDISPPATNYKQPEPRSVCFTPDGSLVIAYLEHGIVCWSPDGKTLKWTFTPRALRIGRFFYSPKQDLFVVHNLYDGFDAYTMKSRAHFRSYRFPASEKDNVPLSCIFINDGRYIVCGTTSGKAVVLDAITLAHQVDLFHCKPGLVQEIAYCNANGANILATTASEKGVETTIKIWIADVVPSQSISYADRITDAFRGGVDLLSDLCARLIRWRSRTIEISIFSLILWVLVLLAVAVALFYLDVRNHGELDLSLHSACRLFWAATKEALFESGRVFRRTLKSGVRTCYSFLKGVAIALYEFLEEEQPSQHASATGSVTTQGGGIEFGGALEKQDLGATQGNILKIEDAFGEQDLDGIARSTQAENALDWATSVGFPHAVATMPVAEDVSNSLPDYGVTMDIIVYAGDLP